MRLLPPPERPLILVTTKETTDGSRNDDTPMLSQGLPYIRAITLAGGAPMMAPLMEEPGSDDYEDSLKEVFKAAKGVLLGGGRDIDTKLYSDFRHPMAEAPSLAHDETERYLLEWAEAENKPLFAICRGLQRWNVANGGTLYQHLPDVPNTIDHVSGQRHPIRFAAGTTIGHTALADMRGDSYHHQAINKLGDGLEAIAWAPDGVIEGIKTTASNWFAYGVQWHPEIKIGEHADQLNLLSEFVDAARTPVESELRLTG